MCVRHNHTAHRFNEMCNGYILTDVPYVKAISHKVKSAAWMKIEKFPDKYNCNFCFYDTSKK